MLTDGKLEGCAPKFVVLKVSICSLSLLCVKAVASHRRLTSGSFLPGYATCSTLVLYIPHRWQHRDSWKQLSEVCGNQTWRFPAASAAIVLNLHFLIAFLQMHWIEFKGTWVLNFLAVLIWGSNTEVFLNCQSISFLVGHWLHYQIIHSNI